MYFQEFYAKQADIRALQLDTKHYHLHAPYLRQARKNRASSRRLLLALGKRLEDWGQFLQKRYGSAPGLAQ